MQEDLKPDLSISSPAINEPTHFDDLINEQETVEQVEHRQEVSTQLMSKDDFHKVFVTGFVFSSHVSGLKSLHVDEGGSARAASDALYDTCLEVPALRFMLQPSNKWWERGFAIAAFTVPIALGVSAELDERRKPKQAGNFSKAKAATAKPSADGEPDKDQISGLTGA